MMFQRYAQILVVLLFSVTKSPTVKKSDPDLVTQFDKQIIPEINRNYKYDIQKAWDEIPENREARKSEKQVLLDDKGFSCDYIVIRSIPAITVNDDKYSSTVKYPVFVIYQKKVYYTIQTSNLRKSLGESGFSYSFQRIITKEYQKKLDDEVKKEEEVKKKKEAEEKAKKEAEKVKKEAKKEADRIDRIEQIKEWTKITPFKFKIYTKDNLELTPTFDDNTEIVTLKNGAITKTFTLEYPVFIKLITAYEAEIKKPRAYLDLGTGDMVFANIPDAEIKKPSTNLGTKDKVPETIDLKTIKLCRRAMSDTIWFELTN